MVVGICRLPGQQPRGIASCHCQQHIRAMRRQQPQCPTATVDHERNCWSLFDTKTIPQGHCACALTRNTGPESINDKGYIGEAGAL